MINIFQPTVGDEELAALRDVFAGNWLGHGPRTRAFEAEFAAHLEVAPERVLFINSCTAGLFMATELLELGPGDDVVLPSISFVGAANAICATGARTVFCDVEPRTLNPTVSDIRRALTPRTKAVFVLHYGGYPGEVAAIAQLCRDRGIALVEDAACAVSSSVDGVKCGTFGDIAMWSFDAMKILVTGDGGMLYVRDPELAKRAHRLAYHGLEHASGMSASVKVPTRWWELNVQDFGRRVVGNDVTAAIGSVQLAKLPGFIERRRVIAETYDRLLSGVDGVRVPPRLPDGHTSSHYFYWVQLDPMIRDQAASDLLESGIYTTFRYAPLHKVPAYRAGGGFLPGAEEASEVTLLLPAHQGLSDADVRTVADELARSVRRHAVQAAA